MRRKSLVLAGLLFAAVVAVNACSEPKVVAHIESTGKKLDSVPAGATRTLTAVVTDQNWHGMEGVDVNWSVLAGAGTIASTHSTTGSDGTASMTYTAPATSGDLTVVTSGIAILGSASSFTIVVK
jgi:hypothetical protein